MNRTDQAPEPTMEEILASIRLIISDDAKKGPSGRDDHPIRSAPPRPEKPPLPPAPPLLLSLLQPPIASAAIINVTEKIIAAR